MRNKRTFEQKVVTDPHEALQRMVYGPGALEACAKAVGVSHQTLSKQINEVDGNDIGLRRSVAIQEFMDSDSLAHCFAAMRGGMFIKLPKVSAGAAPEMVAGFAQLVSEFSDVSKAFSDSMADGHMSAAEIERFEKEAREVYMACEQLVQAARRRLAAEPSTPLAVVK
jgi:hypothetical protein